MRQQKTFLSRKTPSPDFKVLVSQRRGVSVSPLSPSPSPLRQEILAGTIFEFELEEEEEIDEEEESVE